ncbi:MAG: cell wall-binding repeat-containing protein [Coriobacteriia bacterium]|nr:cell wall-binding repeat-containing protein [Coriobacteriia bacterium]
MKRNWLRGEIIMRICGLHARTILSSLVALSLLAVLVPVPALGAVPDVPGLASSTHPNPDAWYADDAPAFEWEAASDLPLLLGTYDTLGYAYGVAVSGTTAYVADGSYGLRIIDVSDPAAPAILGTYDTPAWAYDVAVSGTTAYVADHESGLQVIDVSDPAAPELVGTYDTPNIARAVAVSGTTAYVADTDSGLQIIDVSDSTSPAFLGTYDTDSYARGVAVSGTMAYVADGIYGLQVIDVSDPAAPALLGACDTPDWAWSVAVSGTTAYVADDNSGLQVIDVSDPAAPALVGTFDTPGEARSVAVSGTTAYVADYDSGLQVIDVSDPAAPTLLGTCDTPGGALSVAVSGTTAYVADYASGLQVIQGAEFDPPALLSTYDTPGVALGVAVSGTTAYVADYASGLQVIDVSDPAAPALLGTYDTPERALGVAVSGTTAYVADRGSGLQVIDVSDPAAPALLGTYDTPDDAWGVAVSGTTAYVADYRSGLQVIDVSDPAAPALLGTYDTPGSAYGIAVSGTTAYIADETSGLQVIDVSDPAAPVLLGTYDTPGLTIGIAVSGTTAYVADYTSGLQVIDVSDPAAPALLGTCDTPGLAWGVAVSGTTAYIADASGLQVIDVSDPAAPALLGTYDTPDEAWGVAVSGTTAYVADYASGLQVIDVGHGPVGYSYTLDQAADTVPDAEIDTLGLTTTLEDVADGEWYFHVRAVGEGRRGGATEHLRVRIDTAPPVTTSDAAPSYNDIALITLGATDAGSGVASTLYRLDGGSQQTYTVPIEVTAPGVHTLEYWSVDVAGHAEEHHAVGFEVVRTGPITVVPVQGADRFATAVEVAQASFPSGAETVIIATGRNWPDALGGAALAGAHDAPILLTEPGSLPAVTAAEIGRLEATKAIILGGETAVGPAVVTGLVAAGIPSGNITRIGGATRYETARKVAQATIAKLGATFDGTAFVATGRNYPDALAGSPLAAANGWPIYLVDPSAAPATLAGAMSADGATDALILGGELVVSPAYASALDAALGDVERLAGDDRYATGVAVATHGVTDGGLIWDGLAIATGENFPDALSGGVLCAKRGTVMLLTRTASLPAAVEACLAANRGAIGTVHILGGTGAVSPAVRTAVRQVLEQ